MVFYSTKSNKKVFHLPHCKIQCRIQKEYKMKFDSEQEARAAGFRMCKCCSVVGMRLRREQVAVNEFCQKHCIELSLKDGYIQVSNGLGNWRIIVRGKRNQLFLYHKNTYEKHEDIPSIIPGYHSQAIRSKTIIGYLDYIVQHDKFREREKEKKEKEKKKMQKLRRDAYSYQRENGRSHYNASQLCCLLKDFSR